MTDLIYFVYFLLYSFTLKSIHTHSAVRIILLTEDSIMIVIRQNSNKYVSFIE